MKKIFSFIIAFSLLLSLSLPCFAIVSFGITDDNYIEFDYTYYSNDPITAIYYFILDTFNSTQTFNVPVLDTIKRYQNLGYLVVFNNSALGKLELLVSDYPTEFSTNKNGMVEYSWQHTNYTGTLNYYVEGKYAYILNDSSSLFNVSSSKIGYNNQLVGSNYDMVINGTDTIYSPALTLGNRNVVTCVDDNADNICDRYIVSDEPELNGGSGDGSGDSGYNEDSLIGGLLDGIKDFFNDWKNEFIELLVGIVIPEPGYLENWVNGMVETFNNRSGILTYPLSLLIQFVDTLGTLDEQEPILTIPKVEFMGSVLIPETSFNFNTLLENEAFSSIYSIYILLVKVSLGFGLAHLAVVKSKEFGI